MEDKPEPFVRHGTPEERIKLNADEILDAIAEGRDIDIEYAEIDGSLNIGKITDRLEQDEDGKIFIKVTISFWNVTFGGDTSFHNVAFGSDVGFIDSTFNEHTYFRNAAFCRYADFSDSTFDKYGEFTSAAFCGEAWFNSTTFGRNADFTDTTFYMHAGFIEATFIRKVSFSSATFNEETSFANTTFDGEAFFNSVIFSGHADFGNAAFNDDVSFVDTAFGQNVSFIDTRFSLGVDFRSTRFGKDAGLDRATLSEFSSESLDSIGWAYRKSSLYGGSWFFERAGNSYLSADRCSEASDSFRNAKVEYEKEGKYDEAGRMYIKEKESTRLYSKSQKSNRPKRAWLWIWKHSSNYGESPWRFIGWIAAIVFTFALIYLPIISTWADWWPPVEFEKYPFHRWSDGIIDGFLFNIVAAIYYSAVTFATLGFGDITPVNIVGRLWTIAEVLLGYLMFGVLITLVARKMTRS